MHKVIFMAAVIFAFASFAEDRKTEAGNPPATPPGQPAAAGNQTPPGPGSMQQSRNEQKELTDEDAKQLKNDLNEIIRLRKELTKKIFEFKKKYNMMPDIGSGMESMMGGMRQSSQPMMRGGPQGGPGASMKKETPPQKPPAPENGQGQDDLKLP